MTESFSTPEVESEQVVAKDLFFHGPPSKTECFEQSTCPSNFDPRDLGKRIRKGYKMVIHKGTNRMVLLRFLLAKLIYAKEGLSIEEYLCIYHIFYDLMESTDPLLIQKHSTFLERVSKVLLMMKDIKVFPVHTTEAGEYEILRYIEDFIPTPRQYFGLAGQRDLRRSFSLVLNDSIVPKAPQPKRFIGVGYKDKGTCRDPAYNGSPGWQFYARYFANLERLEAEEFDSSFSSPSDMEK
jgi:hypothetical protein